MRLDAVGSWEGGKRCSTNAHECLCMVYPKRDIPKRDIPKRGMPHREMNMARNTVLYCTVHTAHMQSAAQRKNKARRGADGHLEVSISINQYVRARKAFFGRGYHRR
jgi:hypothetical protein